MQHSVWNFIICAKLQETGNLFIIVEQLCLNGSADLCV